MRWFKFPGILFLILAAAYPSAGCSPTGKNNNDKNFQDSTRTASRSMELPLPAIPDSLDNQQKRADYLVMHFWDSMDWKSDNATDSAFMEQNFVNFLSILPMASEEGASIGVHRLLKASSSASADTGMMQHIIDHYLDDPNSPMRNDGIYMLFLRNMTGMEEMPEEIRERAEYKIGQLMKNPVGAKARDFAFINRTGKHTTLYNSLGKERTMLLFYDPECDQCHEMIRVLTENPPAGVRIIAVDIESDRSIWDETKGELPADWEVGFATDPIDEEEIYVIRALPTMYLLSSDGTILEKN